MGRYQIIDHSSDLFIEAEGEDFCSFVKSLYKGVIDVSVEKTLECEDSTVDIRLFNGVKEELLVSLFNELIFLLYYRNFIFKSCQQKKDNIFSFKGKKCKTIKFSIEIKSATYHQVKLDISSTGVSGRLLFDI